MNYILYNPLASNGKGEENAAALDALLQGSVNTFVNMTETDVPAFVAGLSADDRLYLCGGDGTINRFANAVADTPYCVPVWLYRSGTGNDFLRDVLPEGEKLIELGPYLQRLPTVTINGVTTRYVNGIGYGIDGMVCGVADQKRAAGAEKVNYTALSVRLLLHGYRCPNATVTVDGETRAYRRVWLASAMNGRYYGGGMMVAPQQDRRSGRLTCVVMHGTGKLKTLLRFPGIFQGKHVRYPEMTDVRTGTEITVVFDRPTALQIDGEVVSNVTSYTARVPAATCAAAPATASAVQFATQP